MRTVLVVVMIAGLVMSLVTPGQAYSEEKGAYWQPHWMGYGPDNPAQEKTMEYNWTYLWFVPGTRQHGILRKCVTERIPVPWGATDVHIYSGKNNVIEDSWCATTAVSLVWAGDEYEAMPLRAFHEMYGEIHWPWLTNDDPGDIFVAVDINAYREGGSPVYSPWQTFNFVNGVCPDLPGYIIGTTEVYGDLQLGLVTDNSFTGAVYVNGEDGLCPEPSSLLALGCGLMALGGIAIRRRR